MYQKSIVIDGRMYEVVDAERFFRSPTSWQLEFTALLFTGCYGLYMDPLPDYILPFRSNSELGSELPGIYGMDPLSPSPTFFEIRPFIYDGFGNRIMLDQYSTMTMQDVSNINSIQELIRADAKFKEQDFSILTAGVSAFRVKIGANDTPEMAIFKQAVNDKNIDIDRYRSRIGPTFPNDKRLIPGESITFPKIKSLLRSLDLKATLIIDNAGPDVPNPIPRPLIVNITDGDASSVMTGTYVIESCENKEDYCDDNEST